MLIGGCRDLHVDYFVIGSPRPVRQGSERRYSVAGVTNYKVNQDAAQGTVKGFVAHKIQTWFSATWNVFFTLKTSIE